MPRIKPKFAPGIIKDDSKLAAEGGWVDSDKIRFVGNNPQVIGGTEAISAENDGTVVFDPVVFDPDVFNAEFVQTSEIYPGQARGAIAWVDNDGGRYLAWGTGGGLFVLHNDTVYDITPTEFTAESSDTTLPYGMGLYGSGVYGRGSRVIWSLDNEGQNLLANPRGGGLFRWSLDTAAKAQIIPTAPTQINFMFMSGAERICVLLGTTEFGGDYDPMLVRWSDQGDVTNYTPGSDNLSGEFSLSSGSVLVSGKAARGLNMVWSDSTPYTMRFTGDVNSAFRFDPVGYGCGIIGPHAAACSDAGIFWASRDNFYFFNGQSVSVLPSTVREDVFQNLYPNSEEKMHAGWNTGYSEVWFFYADTRDGTGECSRYASQNSQGQSAVGTFDRTAWVKADVFPYPIAFSANDRRIYYHEVPDAGDGDNLLGAFVESGFIDVGDGDTLYVVTRIIPDFRNQGPNVNISLKTKIWPNETEITKGPYLSTPTTNKLDMRVKARQMAVRIDSEGGAGESFWELGAIGFDSEQSGEKR